jgi:hypothetical protein
MTFPPLILIITVVSLAGPSIYYVFLVIGLLHSAPLLPNVMAPVIVTATLSQPLTAILLPTKCVAECCIK